MSWTTVSLSIPSELVFAVPTFETFMLWYLLFGGVVSAMAVYAGFKHGHAIAEDPVAVPFAAVSLTVVWPLFVYVLISDSVKRQVEREAEYEDEESDDQ